MNRIRLLAFVGAALLAVPVLNDVAHLSGTAEAGSTTTKVAVVDLERTLYETPAGKRADKKFEKTRKKKQGELDKKQKELQKQAAELDKQSTVLKEDVLLEKKADLQQKFVDLQQLYSKLEKDLAAERTALIQDLLKQAAPIIEELAKADNVSLVVDASAVVWADKALDLTDDLNAKMK
jgi:outer membrane protein